MKYQPELHLFILWEHARAKETKILDDLKERFEILAHFEIHWPKETFSQNLTRFYGVNLPPGSDKEQHCGSGAFLAIIVRDNNPQYDIRPTSKGLAWVNTTLFDAKALYRKWTGGGHRVHSTNTLEETEHNVTLLLGKNTDDLLESLTANDRERTQKITKELEGAKGWKSLDHLFYVLNASCTYLVLRNFEYLPDRYRSEEHGDIDLLVEDPQHVAHIVNAQKVFPEDFRVHYVTVIGNEKVYFDFRYLNDMYYDPAWANSLLSNRTFTKKNFFTPPPTDYFYSLLYHALWQKPRISEEYADKLSKLAKKIGLDASGDELSRPDFARSILLPYMMKHSYEFTLPVDHSVYVNQSAVDPVTLPEQSIEVERRGTFFTAFSLQQKQHKNKAALTPITPSRDLVLEQALLDAQDEVKKSSHQSCTNSRGIHMSSSRSK